MASTTLLIDTVLGQQQPTGDSGPLLLAAVQGVEGMSSPYAYDVTMYHTLDGRDIDPQDLVNTPVTIGMRGPSSVVYKELDYYTYRRGFFQSFEKDETTQHNWEQGLQRDFRIYRGRIVPVFKMLDYEIRYRVFEEMTVLEIMQEVMEGFPQIPSYSSYVDDSRIDKSKLQPMLYCVQFGESSFNFLSRLMGLFDIWYYFDHQPDSRGRLPTETMILGRDPANFTKSKLNDMNVVFTAPELQDISGFQRSFAPAHKKIWVSNFNQVKPTDVPLGSSGPKDPYDIWPGTAPYRVQRDVFPAPFDNPRANADAMNEQAESKVEDEENNVFMVQGQCKNPTLVAGRTFHVAADRTSAHFDPVGTPGSNDYIITTLSFAAYENAYGHYVKHDVANFLLSPFRWIWGQFRKKSLTQGLFLDSTAALASGGLTSWVQGQNILNSTKEPYTPPRLARKLPVPPNFADTIVAGLDATLVGSLVQLAISANLKETLQNHGDDYSNSFIALPWDPNATGSKYDQLPNPDAIKPRALGPHLAVVVGQDGTDTKKGDVWADAIGRVRVRFPWQRDVPASQFGLKDPYEPSSDSTEPFKTDRRTCWMRVAEEWAGRSYGTQFLPRIGQEVIVSFIDGDPDRPIVTGRVYNADHGTTNMPFPTKDTASTQIDNVTNLPATARHQIPRSGIKTFSVPTTKPDGKPQTPRYHMLRFDDTRDKEQYLMRSQGRMDVTAFGDYYDTTHGDRHLTIGGQDQKTQQCGGDQRVKIFKNYFLDVGKDNDAGPPGSFCATVAKNYELTVGTSSGKGDMLLDLKRNMITVAQGDISLNASNIVLEAAKKITLKVGASSIVLTDGNIYIFGPPPTHIDTTNGSPDKAADAQLQGVQAPTAADPGDDKANGGSGGGGNSAGGGQQSSRPPTKAQHAPDVVSPADSEQAYFNEIQKEEAQGTVPPGANLPNQCRSFDPAGATVQ